jgi:O-antigen/teichoic acid export membrane protein
MTPTTRAVEPVDSLHSSLVAKATTGTVWTIVAYAATQVVRLLSSIVLSRLLLPQYFGLMALLNTMIIGLNLFSDFGLLPSVIRSEKGDEPRYLDTVWTVQVLRGLGLWLACAALSWPAAAYYHDMRLLQLGPVLGFSIVISSFGSTSLITLNKHMEVRKVALLELFVQTFQLIVTVLIALIYPSVWALVAGRLASDAARSVISHFMIPGYRNRFALDRDTVRDLLSFGKWVFASTAVTFLASQSDRLVLGKLVSMTTLGLYGIAFALADIPRQIIIAFGGRIGLPFVARFSRLERSEFRAVVLRYRRVVLLVGAVLLAVVVNMSDLFLTHVYDVRYRGAAWIAPILALGLWHTILYTTTGLCLTAIGELRYNVTGYIFTALVLLLAVPASFHTWGLLGAVWVVSFSDVPVYLSNLYGLWRQSLLPLAQDIQMTLVFVLCTGGLFLLRHLLGIPWATPVALK